MRPRKLLGNGILCCLLFVVISRLFINLIITISTSKAIPSKTHDHHRFSNIIIHLGLTEMAESTQRTDDLIMVRGIHEETGVLDSKMSTKSPSKTERGLDLENIEIDLPPENI